MGTGKHYFIEDNQEGKFAVREADAERVASLHDTQEEVSRKRAAELRRSSELRTCPQRRRRRPKPVAFSAVRASAR